MKQRSVLLDAAEVLGNRVLRMEGETLSRLQQINGRAVRLCLRQPDLDIVITPSPEGLELSADSDSRCDVSVHGTWGAFLGMLRQQNSGDFISADLEIRGDVGVAQFFTRCLRDVDIDWEEILSGYVGDFPARKIGRFLRQGADRWPRDRVDLERRVREQLQQVFAGRGELNTFAAAVNSLVQDARRVEDRYRRLTGDLKRNS